MMMSRDIFRIYTYIQLMDIISLITYVQIDLEEIKMYDVQMYLRYCP